MRIKPRYKEIIEYNSALHKFIHSTYTKHTEPGIMCNEGKEKTSWSLHWRSYSLLEESAKQLKLCEMCDKYFQIADDDDST